MAILERGKGKRKHVVAIARRGRQLWLQESEAGDKRLPGYRRFVTEAHAVSALEAEVRARLAAGLQPADEEARAIANAQPPKDGPPALPLRCDLAIYNEATGFVVTSRSMAGTTLDEGSAHWQTAVVAGDMLPLMLVQDDSFVIRVVAGEPLSAAEDAEWVARVDWHLNVPDGRLCVTGGAEFTNDDYDPDDPRHEQFVGEIAVPAGRYRAALYTLAHGVNGGGVLDHLAGGYGKAEPLKAWFARTHAGEAFLDRTEAELVDFILHLDPVAEAPTSALSVLGDDGWFGGVENARKPDRCPVGVVGRNVLRSRDETSAGWTYVRPVFDDMPALPLASVDGDSDTVSLPLDSLAHAARIAWFASRFTTVGFQATAAAGASLSLDGEWPDGTVAVQEGATGRVLFDSDLDVSTIIARLPQLATRLASLPDGTTLELCSLPLHSFPGAEGAGLLRLRGTVRDGAWHISQAYPAVSAATLKAALSLAAEIERGATVAVHDESEGHAILAWARKGFGAHLKDNPPKLAEGVIRFKKEGYEVALVGVAAFAQRFAGTWPVVDLTRLD